MFTIAVTTCVAGFYASRVKFDSDIEIWFLENDKELLTYKRFLEQFESDETEVIGIFADDVITKELLEAMDHITERAEQAPYALRVRSLTNATVIESTGAFNISIGPLMDDIPRTETDLAAFKKQALGNVLIRDRLVSANGRAAAIVVDMSPQGNSVEGKKRFVTALEKIMATYIPEGVEWRMSGSPSMDDAFFSYSKRDYMKFGPVAFIVVFLCCVMLLKRPALAFISLSVVGLAVVWTVGLMGMLSMRFNIITSSLSALIIAVGVANSVHVIAEYQRQMMAGLSRNEAVIHAIADLFIPCFFTSATTAAGLLSLMISDLKPVVEFGWLAAVGVSFAFLLSMTFLPSVLSFLPAPGTRDSHRLEPSGLTRLFALLGNPGRKRNIGVLLISIVLTAIGLVELTHLQIGANPINYFLPGDPVREATEKVDKELGGGGSFEILIRTKPGGLKEPSVLSRLASLEERVRSLPAVTEVFSVLDSLREARRLLSFGDERSAVLPDTRPLAAQLYLMLESDDDFRRWILGDYEVTHMTVRARISEATALISRMNELIADLDSNFQDEELRVEVTGYVKLMAEMENYLLDSQQRSFMIAFVVITIMMFLLLGSARLAAFSMIPNFIPIVLGLAFMVPMGISLDPGTVMIGSIALGLVVDDTVHFLVRMRRNLSEVDTKEAVRRTMEQTGRPIIQTSVILALGFSVLTLGSFTPNVAFGMVSAVVIILALAADLIVLPAALLVINPRFKQSHLL